MPTALSLKIVMDEVGETDSSVLSKLTGLSEPQIERCKKLLDLPERFQKLSLEPDPKVRIPSNFWIESAPVLDFAVAEIDSLRSLGRNRATDKLIEKYRAKKIKSVIHFRKIMDAYELSEDDQRFRAKVLRRTEEYFLKPDLETRAAFDEFTAEHKRTQSAVSMCTDFIEKMRRLKIRNTTDSDDRRALQKALRDVRILCMSLDESLEGSDDPDISSD